MILLAVLVAGLGGLLGRAIAAPSAEFDEGVYLASADALAHGARLGSDVFASQPPLFFGLLRGLHAAAGGDAAAMRAVMVAIALGGCVAAWALVRGVAGPTAGVVAAALVGLAPGVVDRAAVVSADVPSLSLAVASLAAGLAATRRPGWAWAAGALAAAALLVKPLALPLLAGLPALWWAYRPPLAAVARAAGAALAVVAAALAATAGSWGEIWTGVAGIREGARAVSPPGDSPVAWPTVLGFAGLAVLLAAGLGGRSRAWLRRRAVLVAPLAAGLLFVALHRPLFAHHWAVVAVPLALLAGSACDRPGRRTAALAAVAAAALLAPGAWAAREVMPAGEREGTARIAALVGGATAPGEPVVSDLPLVPLAAGRRAPPATIDASYVRLGAGGLPRADLDRAVRDAGAAVAGRAFLTVPGLRAELRARFPVLVRVGAAEVYLRGRPEPATR
jgi:hypothetical protein